MSPLSITRRHAAKLLAASLLALRHAESQAAPTAEGVRFSFMLWALTRQAPFDRCIEIVAAAGYQGIELVGEFHTWAPEEKRRILARLRSLGLVIDSMSSVQAGYAVPAETDAFMTQFAEHLQAARELQCPQVILLSGKRIESLSPQAQQTAAIETLKRAAEAAAKNQIEIVIEPIDFLENPTIFLASVTQAFEIVKTVNAPNVKVLYDLYHEQRSFGNLIEKLVANIDRIGLIHVANVPGRHEPWLGEVDYIAIYKKLAELRYNRWIAMEYYPTSDPLASLKKARLDARAALGTR